MITRLKLSTIEQGLPKYRSMLAGNDAYIPTSFESIATATGTGSSGTITFSSIPGTYQHLQIRGFYNSTYSSGDDRMNMLMQVNAATSPTPIAHILRGTGTAASAFSDQRTNGDFPIWYSGYGGPTFGNLVGGVFIIDILDYKSTTKNKTIRSISGTNDNTLGNDGIALSSALWENTSAITSLRFTSHVGNFSTTSTFALYGIRG